MSLQSFSYLDGNAAGGELSNIFALDTAAQQDPSPRPMCTCKGPGILARCPACEHVILRLANIRERLLLDMRGMTHLSFELSDAQEHA